MEFRHLRLRDVSEMLKWGVHQDARLYHYGFNYKEEKLQKMWFHSKYKIFRKYIYGGFIHDTLIGYITLKEINWLKRKAMMGIAIDPNRMNEGFGQTLIKLYLEHVFSNTPIKRIELWVATFNQRAINCYQRAGFSIDYDKVRLYEEQSLGYEILTTYPEIIEKTTNRGIYVKYYKMSVDKENYKKHSSQ